jgi:hypothetical protein
VGIFKNVTCGDKNYKDETSTETQASRTRHGCGDLQGQNIIVVKFKDETLTRA